MPEITIIPNTFAMITVNCYLVETEAGFFLIDTGLSKTREQLSTALEAAGVQPGNLRLVLLTHGDTDHTGNGAYLRQKYGAKLAMHRGDLAGVESGDMFATKKINPVAKVIAKGLFALLGFGSFDTFTPDIFLEDGQDLSDYGLKASVICLPGHSKGSIGILTADGSLFCGDMFENTKKPAVNSLRDDPAQILQSAEKLTAYPIQTLYPGHGKPFAMQDLPPLTPARTSN